MNTFQNPLRIVYLRDFVQSFYLALIRLIKVLMNLKNRLKTSDLCVDVLLATEYVFTACMSVQTPSLGSILKEAGSQISKQPAQPLQLQSMSAVIFCQHSCWKQRLSVCVPVAVRLTRSRVVSHHTQRECVRFELCWPCGCGNDMLLGRWRQTLSQPSSPQLAFESRIVRSKIFDHTAAPIMAPLEERVSTNGDSFKYLLTGRCHSKGRVHHYENVEQSIVI